MALPGWGELLTIVGLCGAFYGVVVGITQSDPKLCWPIPASARWGFWRRSLAWDFQPATAGRTDRRVLRSSPRFGKGALFLAVGVAAVIEARRMALVLVPGAANRPWLGGIAADRRRLS